MRMMLTIQFAHVAVILLPCFCLIHAAGNSNEKQVSDINPYSSSSLLCQNVKNWNYNCYLTLFCFTLDSSLPSCGEIIRLFFFMRVTSLTVIAAGLTQSVEHLAAAKAWCGGLFEVPCTSTVEAYYESGFSPYGQIGLAEPLRIIKTITFMKPEINVSTFDPPGKDDESNDCPTMAFTTVSLIYA